MGKFRGKPAKSLKSKQSDDKKKNDEGYIPLRRNNNFKLNKAPKASDLGEQYIPRKVREIKELQDAMKSQNNKRQRNKKNAVVLEASKHGFKPKPWEDNRGFTRRIAKETHESITHEMFKVRHAMAGRDINEIREDYKELDEAARRKKALKIMRKEKLAKLRAKGKAVKEGEGGDEEQNEDERKPKKEKKQASEPMEKVKKLTKNEKLKEYKKEAKEVEKRELLLNAREVISFGERVDAPPVFSSKFRKEFDPLFANAGSKDLLLKKIMEKNTADATTAEAAFKAATAATTINEAASSRSEIPKSGGSKVSIEDRQKIIDMHRALKKKSSYNKQQNF